jgi:DNA (cytosine-5)-methyltransferase 1
MFPPTFETIRQLRPKAVFIENVRGLARPAFADFLSYILDYLRFPFLSPKHGEHWPKHHRRLRAALELDAGTTDERYEVECHPINVADYGVPQRRVRIIVAAVRHDLAHRWTWPAATHSHEALLLDQLDGYYWERHGLPARSPLLARGTRKRVRRQRLPLRHAPWRTLREALAGLPDPVERDAEPALNWHVLWPGARLYRGHRGSELDAPSKTIKAGVHGVAGGEHIVHLEDGSYRYLTVRECARAQDLPDWLEIDQPRSVAMRQIGNAVPPTIGRVFGLALARCLCDADPVPKATSIAEQDAAAGGYLRRVVVVGGRRVTASVRLQGDYAYLYWTRSAGKPLYLGRVAQGDRSDRLREAWRIAHDKHPDLFIALKQTA